MKKSNEVIRYTIWGLFSAVLNVGLFQALNKLGLNYQTANGITLVLVKIFSYLTNKFFVFDSPYVNLKRMLKEAGSFFLARGFTFVLEFAGVIFCVEFLKWAALQSKCIMAVVVVAVNYLLSKKVVFRKK